MKSAFLLVLFSLFAIGVFDVSVKEGDSVTLHTDVKLQTDEDIEWRFNAARIARVIKKNAKYENGNFTDRLQLDVQTGDLKIKNFRIADTGLFKFEISSPRKSQSKIFSVNAVSDTRSDGVTVVSVTERDSVVLHADVLEIQKNDEIQWRFRDEHVIAKMKKDEYTYTYDNAADGIFKGKLQLKSQTGDIIISDIRNSTSGFYEVDCKKRSYTTHKSFNVTIRNTLNRVQVKEGVSVILESGLTQLGGDDLLQWMFEVDLVIAKINKTANYFWTIIDGANERFRDRLELDEQTGSLTIKKITTEHGGNYHFDIISGRYIISKKFFVFLYGPDLHSDSGVFQGYVAGIVGVILVAAAVVAAVVKHYRHKITELKRSRLNGQNRTLTKDTDDYANEDTELASAPHNVNSSSL